MNELNILDLETDRLKFRQWTEGDYQPVRQFFSEKDHSQYVGGPLNAESSWRLLSNYIGHYQLKGFSYPAIEEKVSGRLIGSVGLWKSVPWPEHEMGYWLLPACQGKGYGMEAGKAVLALARNLKLPTLVSYIDPNNSPSIKLATNLGAKHDGSIDLLSYGLHEVYRYW